MVINTNCPMGTSKKKTKKKSGYKNKKPEQTGAHMVESVLHVPQYMYMFTTGSLLLRLIQ